MEASSNPLPPLAAVSTVYPKLSRNAFSHSSTSSLSSMQRSTAALCGSGQPDRGMVRLQNHFQQPASENCSKLLTRCSYATPLADHLPAAAHRLNRPETHFDFPQAVANPVSW